MTRFLGLLLAALLAAPAPALLRADDAKDEKKDDKKDQLLKGTWTREGDGGVMLTMNFKTKDEFVLTVEVGDASLKATCKYKIEKADKGKKDEKTKPGHRVAAEITKIEAKGCFPMVPEVGYKMKFRFAVEKDKGQEKGKDKTAGPAKLSDYEADNAEQVKPIIEGEYKPKKSD